MKTNQNIAQPAEKPVVTLRVSEIAVEDLQSSDQSVVSADQMEDDSFQANSQNFQNN
jgi:hypothetical protein